jgi:hypothetical protein
MRTKFVFRLIALILILQSCNTSNRITKFCKTLNEIEINKTEIDKAIKLAGQNDDEFTVHACGKSSGHSYSWTTYKNFGIALYTTSYTPERKDGYKNEIIRNIGIFDSANLNLNGSAQQSIYYNQDFPNISTFSLKTILGKAENVKNIDTIQYHVYTKRKIIFAFHKQNKNFLRLYISK